MTRTFADRVAVVTGASSGLGWALAKELAREGAKVGLIARRREKLAILAEEIRTEGGNAFSSAADIGDRAQTLAAIGEVRSQLGSIDLMVANAGVGIPTLLRPPNVPDVEKMFRVNVLGMVYAFEAVIPEMLEQRSGHLAAVSSLAAYKGMPGESGYCASKAAVNCYLEGLRIHVRHKGIRVTTICPGFIKTPMTDVNEFPMPFLWSAEKAAQRIVRALKNGKKVYNFPWQTALLMKMACWLPDWMIAKTMKDYNKRPPMPRQQ